MRLLVLSGSTTGRAFRAEKGDKTFDVVSGVGFLNFQGLDNSGTWQTVRKVWYSSPEKVTLGDNYDVWRVVPSTVQTAFVVYCDDAEAQGQDTISAESLGAGPDKSAAVNTAVLQAAFDAGRRVTITNPGTYNFRAGDSFTALYMDDDTELYLGAGVVLARGTDAGSTLVCNRNFNSNSVRITSFSDASAGTNVRRVTVTTETEHGLEVGKWFQVKGDTSRTYLDIWQVETAPTATTLTFLVHVSDTLGAGAGNMYLYPANNNIRIVGPGRLDFGAVAASSGDVNGRQRMGIIFNHVRRWYVGGGLSMGNSEKYNLYYGNSYDGVVEQLRWDNQSNGPQGIGPIYNQRLYDCECLCADDPFAVTVTNAGFSQYDMRDQPTTGTTTSGNTTVTVANTDIFAIGQVFHAYRTDTGASAFATGAAVTIASITDGEYVVVSRSASYSGSVNAYPVSSEGEIVGVSVDNLRIKRSTTGRLLLGAGSAGDITDIRIKNVRADTAVGLVMENLANAGAGTIGSCVVEAISAPVTTNSHYSQFGTIATSLTIQALRFSSMFDVGLRTIGATAAGLSGSFFNISNNVTIDTLYLDKLRVKCDQTNGSANAALVNLSTSATVSTIHLSDIKVATDAGTTRSFFAVLNTGTLTNAYLNNVEMNVGIGGLINNAGVNTTAGYYLTNCRQIGGNIALTASQSCAIWIANSRATGLSTSTAQLSGTSKTYTLSVSNCANGGNNFLRATGTSSTYNLIVNGTWDYNAAFISDYGTTNTITLRNGIIAGDRTKFGNYAGGMLNDGGTLYINSGSAWTAFGSW